MAQGLGLRGSLSVYRSLQGTPMHQKLTLVKSKLQSKIKPRIARLRRRTKTGHIGAVFRTIGPEAGIKAFWSSPFSSQSWYDVNMRMQWIADRYPKHLASFVARAFETTKDANILIGLAESTLSDTHLRQILPLPAGTPPDSIQSRMKNSQVFTAAYVGTQMLLNGPEAGQAADTFARCLHRLPRWNYDRYLDSLSFCPQTDSHARQFKSCYQSPKMHRLLILESAKTKQSYQHLLRDATNVTIIDMTDMYGKTTFDDMHERGVETIEIEHVRSRITRFSPDYHALHQETKDAAERVMAQLTSLQDADTDLFGQATPHITLDVADLIFFEALKVRALAKLIADPRFDHIVVAHAQSANRPYDRLLSCVSALRKDPRVEFVSTARSLKQRLAARTTILTATRAPDIASTTQIPPLAIADLKDDLRNKVTERVNRIDSLPEDGRDRLLLMTSHSPAYNPSTAATLKALANEYQVSAIFAGGSLNNFLRNNPAGREVIASVTPITLSHRLLPNLSDISRWLQVHFQDAAACVQTPEVRAVMLTFTGQIVRNSLLPGVADYAFITGWLDKLQRDGQLPILTLVSPQRSAKLGTMSEAARDFGIPSLGLEPHGLNGNYCRYSKVAMDYYGVISDYFRMTAESDFGITKDRCRVIGSPRIIAPTDYVPQTAEAEARATLSETQNISFDTNRTYISFFCQPSSWAHVAKVWTNILVASEELDVTILLKTHPEESKARISRYMALAAELKASDRVYNIDADPNTVIKASDLVLTGYSAAAIDAAVLQKPVLCVTADNKPYPVDQHSIVHSTLCGDAEALRSALQQLLQDQVECDKRAKAFLTAEPQFVSGPDALLQSFVADILAKPQTQALRSDVNRPSSLFLDGPFPTFDV